MKIQSRVENSKAYLEFEFPSNCSDGGMLMVLLQVKDAEGRMVLNCPYPLAEEEPAQGILLHPHLWNGHEDPYLYQVEVYFVNKEGKVAERQQEPFGLYTLEEIPGKGLFLNGKSFELRAVCWDGEAISAYAAKQGMAEVLEQLRLMGANAIYFMDEEKEIPREYLSLCMQKGFLVFAGKKEQNNVPFCSSLFSLYPTFFTEKYYQYKALWSREPFVHINMSSIRRQENGNFSLMVCSNQKKTGLYVDGVLFEFRNGGQEYLFEEIPIKKYPAVLTAQAGEYNTAVTIYESSQNFHNYFTFS